MNTILRILGVIYVIFGIVALYAGIVALSDAIIAGIVYLFVGFILLRKINFFSFFSKKAIIISLLACPIAVFIAGFIDGDERFQNPIIIARFFLFTMTMIPLLISFIFANELLIYARWVMPYKLLLSLLCYGISIIWFYEIYLECGNIYFKLVLFLLIPAYILSYGIYALKSKIWSINR